MASRDSGPFVEHVGRGVRDPRFLGRLGRASVGDYDRDADQRERVALEKPELGAFGPLEHLREGGVNGVGAGGTGRGPKGSAAACVDADGAAGAALGDTDADFSAG